MSAKQPNNLSKYDPCWERLKEGHKQALKDVYIEYANVLYNYGRHICKDGDLVRDCIQDLFIELWERHSSLSSTTSVRFYLYSCLRRKLISEIGKNKTQLTAREPTEEIELQHLFELDEADSLLAQRKRTVVLNLVDTLPKRQKEALLLVFFENLSREEVSEIMGVSTETVYSLIWRAISKLKKTVQRSSFTTLFTSLTFMIVATASMFVGIF